MTRNNTLQTIAALIDGYENLPCCMGETAKLAACSFINENHDGFRAIKSLYESAQEMASALDKIAHRQCNQTAVAIQALKNFNAMKGTR